MCHWAVSRNVSPTSCKVTADKCHIITDEYLSHVTVSRVAGRWATPSYCDCCSRSRMHASTAAAAHHSVGSTKDMSTTRFNEGYMEWGDHVVGCLLNRKGASREQSASSLGNLKEVCVQSNSISAFYNLWL